MSVQMMITGAQAKEFYGVEIDEPFCFVCGPKHKVTFDNAKIVLLAYAKMCMASNTGLKPPAMWNFDLSSGDNKKAINRPPLRDLEKIHADAVKDFDLALEKTGLNLLDGRKVSLGPPIKRRHNDNN